MLRPAALGLLTAALLATPASPAAATPTTSTAAPSVAVDPSVITAGGRASVSGSATPGQTVDLYGYSRPSTTFALLRQTTAAADGSYAFAVLPPTNSRYHVSVAEGPASPSVALAVRTAVVLDQAVADGDTLTVSGRVLPRTTTKRIEVVLTRDGRRTVVATTASDLRGQFRARVVAEERGAFEVTAAVPATLDNAAGESAPRQVVLRAGQAAGAGQPG